MKSMRIICNRYSTRRVVLFSILLIVFMLITTRPMVGSWNDASRMATIESLVERRTFIIDDSTFINTGDKVLIDGHFYSDKPPFPSILGAVLYLPLYHLGLELDYGWNMAYYLLTLFTVKLFWLLGLIAFYYSLSFTRLDGRMRFLLTAALGLASLYFSWSSAFNNHLLAASFLSIGFAFLLEAKRSESTAKHLFLSSLFIALAGVTDLTTAVFWAAFAVYVLVDRDLRSKIHFFRLPLLLTLAPTMIYYLHIHGSVIPVSIVRSYFEYPGSPWIEVDEFSGMYINSLPFFLSYGFKILLGSKGFLLYNPLIFVAIPGLILEIKRKRIFSREALTIGMASLILYLYIALMTTNYGGGCYSIRWFVPLLPMLFFFIHPLLEGRSTRYQWLLIVLGAVSIALSFLGLINPWTDPEVSEFPAMVNVKMIPDILRLLSP